MNPQSDFPETHWSRLEREAANPDGSDWFCETYHPVILACLRSRISHHDAEDVCQEFFARVVLGRNLMQKADRTKGCLRTILRASLDNFLISWFRERNAQKRGGGVVHQRLSEIVQTGELSPVSPEERPDDAFDRMWASHLMERALEATRQECADKGREKLFTVLRPMLDGSNPGQAHAETGALLGISAREVTVALSRLRQRVARNLYREVSLTVMPPASIADEMEAMRLALAVR